MQLFIMRHGNANQFGVSDAQRELTEKGKSEVLVMAAYIQDNKLSFDRVIVSPFKRAQQTAQILLSAIDCAVLAETLDFIIPSGSARNVHDYIDGLIAKDKSVNNQLEKLLIISHMPLVSYLVEELTQGQDSPIFQTAAIAKISYDNCHMTGHLDTLVSPS